MLFELLSIFTTLPFGFIPISCNNNSLASFLRTIRPTWHLDCLPWSVMQRQPRIGGEEEWLPCGKNIWQTKKVTTSTELPDCLFSFFSEPFFNIIFFWVEDFRKYQMADFFLDGLFEASNVCSTAMMWGATGILTTHDPGAQDSDWWIRAGKSKWLEMEIKEIWD